MSLARVLLCPVVACCVLFTACSSGSDGDDGVDLIAEWDAASDAERDAVCRNYAEVGIDWSDFWADNILLIEIALGDDSPRVADGELGLSGRIIIHCSDDPPAP